MSKLTALLNLKATLMELFTIARQTDNSDDIDFLLDTLNNLNQEIEMEQKKENNANKSEENDGNI